MIGVSSKSLAKQYTNVFIVFFFSGALHLVLDTVQGIPAEESGAMLFFATAPLGLIIEDGVKGLWRFSGKSNDGDKAGKSGPLARWQKTLGFGWTMAWLGITSTWYFYPQMLRPQNQALVPFSFASHVGLPILGLVVLVGGAIAAYIFEVEV